MRGEGEEFDEDDWTFNERDILEEDEDYSRSSDHRDCTANCKGQRRVEPSEDSMRCLRMIAQHMKEHGRSLKHVYKVGDHSERGDEDMESPASEICFRVDRDGTLNYKIWHADGRYGLVRDLNCTCEPDWKKELEGQFTAIKEF
jgi:hypothetical protein